MKHQHLMRNINTIARCASLFRDEHLKDTGLSGWQAPYIPEIIKTPGITQEELAQKLHVNRSNVTRQLTLLEDNGFVIRKRCETDRRSVEVYPTDKAREAHTRVKAVYKEWRELLFEGMSEKERNTLEIMLDGLAKRAEELK